MWAHVTSRDLVRWRRLPVALWNAHPWDSRAVYTGSATVLPDGTIAQVYPGICKPNLWPGCSTGTTLAVAVPSDPSDPLLTRWNTSSHPILNNTQRDPTTAWQTDHGEWRLLTFDTSLYATRSFDRGWYRVGTQAGIEVGECPSLYRLPRTTPGASSPQAKADAAPPTHVFKRSNGWADWVRVGGYVDGAPGHAGTWTPWPWNHGNTSMRMDFGEFYASKDLVDAAGRRITFGWAAFIGPLQGPLTLPREVTWHPELEQLVYSPLAELKALRTATLADVGARRLPVGSAVPIGREWSRGEGLQAEVEVSFGLPSHAATVGVSVMGERGRSHSGMLYWVAYQPRVNRADGRPHAIKVGSVNQSISVQ